MRRFQRILRVGVALAAVLSLTITSSPPAVADTTPAAVPVPAVIDNYFYAMGVCGTVNGSVPAYTPYVFVVTWTNDDGTSGGGEYGAVDSFSIETTRLEFTLHVVLKSDPAISADIVVTIHNVGCPTPSPSPSPSPTPTTPDMDLITDWTNADGVCGVVRVTADSKAPVSYLVSWTNDNGTSASRELAPGGGFNISTTKTEFKIVFVVKSDPTNAAYGTVFMWNQYCKKTFAKTYAPTISGKVKVGRKLTAKVKRWSPVATHFTYRWYANGKAIKGATRSTYRIPKRYRGKKITVKVVGSRHGYYSVTKTSRPTKKVKRR